MVALKAHHVAGMVAEFYRAGHGGGGGGGGGRGGGAGGLGIPPLFFGKRTLPILMMEARGHSITTTQLLPFFYPTLRTEQC